MMDQFPEDYKPPVRGVAQQYEQQRRNYAALMQAAQLIPTAINKRYAKKQWCEAARLYLNPGKSA